jgi:hypothetical protein
VGFVKGPIIEQEQMEAGGIGGGKMVEEELKAVRIESGQCEKEALARERFNGAVQIETLEVICCRQERWDAPSGDPPA